MKKVWNQSFEQHILLMSINLLSIGLDQIPSAVTKGSEILLK
jgi:hypothetical protein